MKLKIVMDAGNAYADDSRNKTWCKGLQLSDGEGEKRLAEIVRIVNRNDALEKCAAALRKSCGDGKVWSVEIQERLDALAELDGAK